jgi:hypothetical protein
MSPNAPVASPTELQRAALSGVKSRRTARDTEGASRTAVFGVGRGSSAGTGPTQWTSWQGGTGAIRVGPAVIRVVGADETVADIVTHPMTPSVMHT